MKKSIHLKKHSCLGYDLLVQPRFYKIEHENEILVILERENILDLSINDWINYKSYDVDKQKDIVKKVSNYNEIIREKNVQLYHDAFSNGYNLTVDHVNDIILWNTGNLNRVLEKFDTIYLRADVRSDLKAENSSVRYNSCFLNNKIFINRDGFFDFLKNGKREINNEIVNVLELESINYLITEAYLESFYEFNQLKNKCNNLFINPYIVLRIYFDYISSMNKEPLNSDFDRIFEYVKSGATIESIESIKKKHYFKWSPQAYRYLKHQNVARFKFLGTMPRYLIFEPPTESMNAEKSYQKELLSKQGQGKEKQTQNQKRMTMQLSSKVLSINNRSATESECREIVATLIREATKLDFDKLDDLVNKANKHNQI